jgi:hypothetical protein
VPDRLSKAQRGFIDAYREGLGPRAAAQASEAQLCSDALAVAARVSAEIEQMQRSGGLKSVNQSYRTYRLETSARGERVLPYAAWLDRYKAGLVREIATNLR